MPTLLREQERRRKNNLADEIYDVTAWSLPQMFNVSYQTCAKLPRVATVAAGTDLIKPVKLIRLMPTWALSSLGVI